MTRRAMGVLGNIVRLLPKSWARGAREARAIHRLRRVVAAFGGLELGASPSSEILFALKEAWGNPGWSAELAYLEVVAREAASTAGPVLECGSGLTTFLLGLVAGRRGVPIWTLEHITAWREWVCHRLSACGVPGTLVLPAPLESFGSFDWYAAPLDKLPRFFSLVVCDGPPQSTRGGRYGLVPVLGDRLARNVTILLDDARRPGEVEVLARWEREASLQLCEQGAQARYAVVRRP